MNFYVTLALCFLFAALSEAKRRDKVDLTDVVNPDPEATSTETKEYGKYVEGDMKIEGGSPDNRNAIKGEHKLWPEGKVPFVFESTVGRDLKAKINSAINDFTKHTCIRFTPRRRERGYISFDNKEGGCWSYVGHTGGPQTINVETPGCDSKGTIIHEMLHALGFFHEQSRSDRDSYIKVHFENIEKEYHNQFNKLDAEWEEEQLGLPYDYSSVMHYGPMGFAIGDKPAITTKSPKDQDKIGQRAGFSKQDIEEVNTLYGCNGKTRKTTTTTTTPSPNCFDKKGEYCERTLKQFGNYCNTSWFKDSCQKSCNICKE